MKANVNVTGKKDVKILNDLVRVNSDRIREYEKAIDGLDTKKNSLKSRLYGKDRLGKNYQPNSINEKNVEPLDFEKSTSSNEPWIKNQKEKECSETNNKSSEELKDEKLINTFDRMIKQSNHMKAELKDQLLELGEEFQKSVSGKIYKTWEGIRDTFSNYPKLSNIEMVEFNEDAAQATYDKALEDTNLNYETRKLISNQKSELKKSHDEIKVLCDIMEPSH